MNDQQAQITTYLGNKVPTDRINDLERGNR